MKTYKKNIKFHPDSINTIKKVLTNNHLKLSANNQIVFLFGAKSDSGTTAREVFFQYTQKHLTQYQFLQAEDFFKLFEAKIDLLTIEQQLATYTDCVLILLESPGSIAELGAFALHNDLVKLILAVNKEDHKGEESFISLGPLAKIDKYSEFGPTIYANFKSILRSVNEIESRLKNNLRKNAKTINLSTIEDFKSKKNKKYKLLLLADIITLFGPIIKEEVLIIFKEIYGEQVYIEIDFELSLLESLSFIKKEEEYFFKSATKEFFFYNYSKLNINNVRYRVINHYAKYQPHRLDMSKRYL